MLARQAAWQSSRTKKTWAEKLRMAILMREDLKTLRKPQSREDTPHRKGADHPPKHRLP